MIGSNTIPYMAYLDSNLNQENRKHFDRTGLDPDFGTIRVDLYQTLFTKIVILKEFWSR
jgi:hypothetical protein